jgi:hypothetical protein
MKKIRIGLPVIALMIAIAGSAFTTISKSTPANQTDLFWYVYDADTDELVSQIGSGQVSKEEAASTGCESDQGVECARAYSSPMTGLPISGPQSGVDFLSKGN